MQSPAERAASRVEPSRSDAHLSRALSAPHSAFEPAPMRHRDVTRRKSTGVGPESLVGCHPETGRSGLDRVQASVVEPLLELDTEHATTISRILGGNASTDALLPDEFHDLIHLELSDRL